MSTPVNPQQHRDNQPAEPTAQTPRPAMPAARVRPFGEDHRHRRGPGLPPSVPAASLAPPSISPSTTSPSSSPAGAGPAPEPEPPFPEFLQAARRHAAAPMTPPAATVVPVLDDQLQETETETETEAGTEIEIATETGEAPGLSPYELDELEREIARTPPPPLPPRPRPRPHRTRTAEYLPPPPPPPQRPQARLVSGNPMSALLLRLGAVGGLLLLLALLFAGKIALPPDWRASAAEPFKRLAELFRADPAPAAPPAAALHVPVPAMPKLTIEGADAGNGDDIGLGVKVSGPIEGVTAIIDGIAAGTTLSKGQPWGETGWFVPAAQLAETRLRPPAGFAGVMQYSVALKMPDGRIADRQTLRLQWSAAASGDARDTAELRQLASDEIATLLKRGQTMFENGDLAGARLLLRRAAEAGDAVAAMAMAATYDPSVLKELGVRGLTADVGKARFWYEKAREYGSKEAPRRLESLASQGR